MTTRRTRTVNPSTVVETTDNAPAPQTSVPSGDASVTNAPDPSVLPVAYPPLLFSHSMFLLALSIILPRSSFLIPFIADNIPKRDRGFDRPQAAWLGRLFMPVQFPDIVFLLILLPQSLSQHRQHLRSFGVSLVVDSSSVGGPVG